MTEIDYISVDDIRAQARYDHETRVLEEQLAAAERELAVLEQETG